MSKYYTGIGSRETPAHVLEIMRDLASKLCSKGWILRSGGAAGADNAFESGVGPVKKLSINTAEIYLPWNGFNDKSTSLDGYLAADRFQSRNKAIEILKGVLSDSHVRCLSPGALKLQTRNIYQVLGKDLDVESDFLICWTKDGKDVGGTATAIKLARKLDIPVYNLGTDTEEQVDKLYHIAELLTN
jgi:hypothetical protein